MLSSLTVPLKLVSQSQVILSGLLPLLMDLTNVFLNLCLVPVLLRFTARLVRYVNNAPHCLILALLYFISIGPNTSTPVFANADFMRILCTMMAGHSLKVPNFLHFCV